jgi:hypothetical protein
MQARGLGFSKSPLKFCFLIRKHFLRVGLTYTSLDDFDESRHTQDLWRHEAAWPRVDAGSVPPQLENRWPVLVLARLHSRACLARIHEVQLSGSLALARSAAVLFATTVSGSGWQVCAFRGQELWTRMIWGGTV